MNTNINTDNNLELSTDIYDISAFFDQIRKNHISNIDETSSMIGIFGYMNEMFSQSLQNALIVAAETSNETIPTKAKFTKNIINHIMNLGITDIFAKPAIMSMMIYIPISYIEKNSISIDDTKKRFILDKRSPIFIDKYEYHLDYDIIITRIKNSNNKIVHTAMYDLFDGNNNIKQDNPLSNISNPYITTLLETTIDKVKYLALAVKLHQIEMIQNSVIMLTNNYIENKSITFEFEDQLASFDIDIINNDNEIVHLVPIYSGLLNDSLKNEKWCYYEFINEHTIRVIFDRESYIPQLNSKINININLCSGSSANFTYNDTFKTALKSEKYNDYNGMYVIVQPLQNGLSYGGKDKKSISDMKKIIPREASSRGAIINTTDLQNFFNSINDNTCKLYFKKKKDNQFERMYYTYLLMKKDGCVYPTNTLNLRIRQNDFNLSSNTNLIIKPGTVFYYYDHGTDKENDYATTESPQIENGLDENKYPYPMTINKDGNLVRVFKYISPFLINIDNDLISSYMMTLMDETKLFKFSSINQNANVQFVATNINWKRNFILQNDSNENYDNKYILEMDIVQNNEYDSKLVKYAYDNDGNIIFTYNKIKVILVLYADSEGINPYKYIEGELYDVQDIIYKFRFTFYTDDILDSNNRIKISGIYNTKQEKFETKDELQNSYGYMLKNTYAKVFIMADLGNNNNEDIKDEITSILPSRDDIEYSYLFNKINSSKNNNANNIISLIKSNETYLDIIKEYNNNDLETEEMILLYIKNHIANKYSDYIISNILNNNNVKGIIDSYNYIDLSNYTMCNVLSIDGGLDFYHDYSQIMRSSVSVNNVAKRDEYGNIIYRQISKIDNYGNRYIEYTPIWLYDNENNIPIYQYVINRIPVIKANYLKTENDIQNYIYILDERRKYINECLLFIEDTFDIDLKFFNTYGPSKTFYYDIPSSQNYKVKVNIKKTYIYDDSENEIQELPYGTELLISKINGQRGYCSVYNGWIKLADTIKLVDNIDNVALTFKFAVQLQPTADKNITENIKNDIKEYIEDMSSINELHIPNIITLITNNYRNQIIYFEFLGVNNYNSACQHLYFNDKIEADICPEFLNIELDDNGAYQPLIDIVTY